MQGWLIFGGVCLGAGILLGNKTATPEVDFVEVPKTVTVTEEAPPPVEVAVFPESCQRALEYALRLERNGEKLFHAGDKQLAIFSDARLTLAAGGDLNAIENEQRRLRSSTVGSLYNMTEAFYQFELAYEECHEEID